MVGTSSMPRLAINRSNRYIYAQLIDDIRRTTLATIDDVSKEAHKGKDRTNAARELGKVFAERAKKVGIKSVVFDKGSYRYHGRVKSFAEGAREGGLVF